MGSGQQRSSIQAVGLASSDLFSVCFHSGPQTGGRSYPEWRILCQQQSARGPASPRKHFLSYLLHIYYLAKVNHGVKSKVKGLVFAAGTAKTHVGTGKDKELGPITQCNTDNHSRLQCQRSDSTPDNAGEPAPVTGLDLQLRLWGNRLGEKGKQGGNKCKQKHYISLISKSCRCCPLSFAIVFTISELFPFRSSWMFLIKKGQGKGRR